MKLQDAIKRHDVVRRAARDDIHGARSIWAAAMGEGEPEFDSYAEAVIDMAPTAHAKVLSMGGTATAYAFDCLWQLYRGAADATPHERRELARAAWDRFEERATQAEAVRYGLGCDESMAWESTRQFSDVADGLCTVEQIAAIAGRMMAQLQRNKSQKVSPAPEEVYSVELGNDFGRLLPSELAHLGQPTELVLLDNIANSKCMQYAMRGSSDAGRGPLVIALDESGSMHNTRGQWAKAAAVALTRVAWEDNRTVAVVHWSTSATTRTLRPGDHKGLLAMIQHWMGGGTTLGLALENAADLVDELQKKGDRGADVVLVTDGQSGGQERQERAIKRLNATGARLWTVAVELHVAPSDAIRAKAEQFTGIGGAEIAAGDASAMEGAVI